MAGNAGNQCLLRQKGLIMAKMQRSKGGRGERELAKLLADRLGVKVSRNLLQTREGGYDLNGIEGWALEVKRQESLAINSWWKQTLEQSKGAKPVLAYRQSRKPWRFVVRLCDVCEDMQGDYTAELCIEGFCQLVREK